MFMKWTVDRIICAASLSLAAGAIAPKILEKVNEDETSKALRIFRTIGVYAGCYAVGFLGGSILNIEASQDEFTRLVLEASQKATETVA